jgi:hypothetical protein
MNVSGQDINQTLEYRYTTALVRLLPTGLLLIFLGLFILSLFDPDREPVVTLIVVVVALALGGALLALALWRRWNHGKPLFTLAPDGIHYRIPLVKDVLIPWREIQGVDTIDIETGYWSIYWPTESLMRREWVIRNVTVVLLPQPFYDRRIHVDSFLLRGPGWKANFIPKGSLMQMALHHELVSVEARPLREAVEARWLAFRNRPAAESARTSVPSVTAATSAATVLKTIAPRAEPTSGVIAMGENPKAISPWEATKIIVPLIAIAIVSANLAGLWQLPGRAEQLEARAKARQERIQKQKLQEESFRKQKAESKRLETEDRERQRKFEEDMRRAFGR